ncbi:MAG: methyltransferase family protein [Candidatus Sulfotelmatobacter sp.]
MELKSRLLARLPLAVIIPALLFACAGSLRFWQAWLWLVVFVFPMLALMFYLYRHDPKVLERRMRVHEKIGEQKIYQIAVSLAYPLCLVIAGLDYRFGWSRNLLAPVPVWLTLIADGGVLSGLLLVFEVFRVNRFAARTIQVEAGQPVVSTGPYRLVRHPMYLGGAVTLLSYPLALASWIAMPLSALIIPVLVLRLLGEEKFLRSELPGYSEYCLRTRHRLIPLIW